jgi:hypothetical protein
MSEFARAVLQHPVTAERREAEREANRLFKKLKVPFRDAVVRDQGLTRAQRLIGYEIADRLNFKIGYAWPSQELIAEKVRCDVRTVRRAMERLTHEKTGWFRRELDGKNYCYFPRFERLNQPPQPVENTGHLVQRTPDIRSGQNVRLSSLIDPIEKENLDALGGKAIMLPPERRKPIGRMDDRSSTVLDFGNQDELITTAARAEGNPAFVFLDSQPWHLWNEYRIAEGLPPLRPRQHHVNGLLRAGADVPTLYPPGHGRHSTPRALR